MSPSRSTPTTSPIRGPSSRRTPRVLRRSSHPISITDLRYVLNSENDEKDTLHIVLSAGGRLHVVRQEPLRRCAARTPCDGRVSRGVRRLFARRRRGETLRPQYGQCLYRPDRCAGPRRVPRRCRALPSLGARPARRFGGIQRYDRAGRPCRRGQGSRRGAEIFQAGYDPHQGDLLGRLHAGSAGDGTYADDKYIILHNNGFETYYLDGCAWAMVAPYNSQAANPWTSTDPSATSFSAITPPYPTVSGCSRARGQISRCNPARMPWWPTMASTIRRPIPSR